MQLKFSLQPDDYLNIVKDYYKNTDEGKKDWRAAQYKMTFPILILLGLFYFLHRDALSTAFLLLVSVTVLFFQSPKFVIRRYRKRLMKEDYADKFKETLYRISEDGIATFNQEKRTQVEWKDVKILRKTGEYIWLRTNSKLFLIFPRKYFDPVEDFEKLYATLKKSVGVEGTNT